MEGLQSGVLKPIIRAQPRSSQSLSYTTSGPSGTSSLYSANLVNSHRKREKSKKDKRKSSHKRKSFRAEHLHGDWKQEDQVEKKTPHILIDAERATRRDNCDAEDEEEEDADIIQPTHTPRASSSSNPTPTVIQGIQVENEGIPNRMPSIFSAPAALFRFYNSKPSRKIESADSSTLQRTPDEEVVVEPEHKQDEAEGAHEDVVTNNAMDGDARAPGDADLADAVILAAMASQVQMREQQAQSLSEVQSLSLIEGGEESEQSQAKMVAKKKSKKAKGKTKTVENEYGVEVDEKAAEGNDTVLDSAEDVAKEAEIDTGEKTKKKRKRNLDQAHTLGEEDQELDGEPANSISQKNKKSKKQAIATDSESGATPSGATVSVVMETPKRKTQRKEKIKTGAKEYEELRAKLNERPDAVNEFLASKWIDIKELQRLEQEGIISYKRGKFTEAEKQALKEHIQMFKDSHRLSETELLEVIMGKGRQSKRNDYPKFYPDLAAQVPGRPVRYVKEAVKRMYDPRSRKGAWTEEEDETLLRVYNQYPNEWTKIAAAVDRTELDCRDRYKNELIERSRRHNGAWSQEETNELIEAVKKINTQLGVDPMSYDPPWDVVAQLMGWKRTRKQCRQKWQDMLTHEKTAMKRTPGESHRYLFDRRRLINRLRELQFQNEKDIIWKDVISSDWEGINRNTVRSTWSRMLSKIQNRENRSFDDILNEMESNIAEMDMVRFSKTVVAKTPAIIYDEDA